MRNILSILILIPLIAVSQQSKLGRFSIEYGLGCAPVTIAIQKQDELGDISRQYTYEQGLIQTPDTFHTFTSPGIYEIVQFLGEDIEPKTDTLRFEVLEGKIPLFNILKCDDNTIQVAIEDNYYDYYWVWFSQTDSVLWRTNDPFPVYSYAESRGQTLVKGFFDHAFPSCGELSSSFNLSNTSDESIDAVEIIEVCRDDFHLNLKLKNHSTFSSIRVLITAEGIQHLIYEGALFDDINTFSLEPSLTIKEDYCVEVIVINPCENQILSTTTQCSKVNLNKPNLSQSYATYTPEGIGLLFDTIIGKNVEIKRRRSNREQFTLLTQSSFSFVDKSFTPDRAYEYLLIETDTCGNRLDSVIIAPPYIQLTDRNQLKNTISVSYSPPVNGLSPSVEELLFYSNSSLDSLRYPLVNSYDLPGNLGSEILLRSQYLYDSIVILSNEISAPYDVTVFVPSAFSPNGDSLNDSLKLFGLPTGIFKINIYDKWGKVIHSSTENPVWSGKIGKDRAEEGTYIYQIIFELKSGGFKEQVGSFTLLRN